MADLEYCMDCKYFERLDDDGICKRYPPVICGSNSEQPTVSYRDQCGEFTPRDEMIILS